MATPLISLIQDQVRNLHYDFNVPAMALYGDLAPHIKSGVYSGTTSRPNHMNPLGADRRSAPCLPLLSVLAFQNWKSRSSSTTCST